MKIENYQPKLGIIGLGYVGLPLAVEFAKKYKVIGYDINVDRINELKSGIDHTLEIDSEQLNAVITPVCTTATGLYVTDELEKLRQCSIYIVTVPTPVDKNNRPDLSPLIGASRAVGKVLKKGDIVVYESTVYPGVTEDECMPILEKVSGLTFNVDFFAGYSPERINPGDKLHTVSKIRKITSGSTPEAAETIDKLYQSVITAGTFKAHSIKVAEAAKVIENAQRDINIAFVNELAMIFNKLGIDTHKVLEAAGTKWNFLPFKPGLVGGHCIGVDPYYLTHKAESLGYHPEVILSGRRINDNMSIYIANTIIKLMAKNQLPIHGADVLVLGITFKENCPDIRNSKVIDVVRELQSFGTTVDIYDPQADTAEVKHEYGVPMVAKPNKKYHAVVLAVNHQEFQKLDWSTFTTDKSVVYDVKGALDKNKITARL